MSREFAVQIFRIVNILKLGRYSERLRTILPQVRFFSLGEDDMYFHFLTPIQVKKKRPSYRQPQLLPKDRRRCLS
jgi:hypothetical protein